MYAEYPVALLGVRFM